MEGYFITFEGIEKCGKTTQAELLVERLQKEGYQVVFTREPGGPPIAEKIRALILDPTHTEMSRLTELFLYMASRAQHIDQLIRPHLQSGGIVLCDRFADSTRAYQGYGRGIDFNTIEELNRMATSGCVPDLTLLLDIPLEASLERQAQLLERPDRLENEAIDFYRQVRQGYLQRAQKYQYRMCTIDGTKGVEHIAQEIYSIVMERLGV